MTHFQSTDRLPVQVICFSWQRLDRTVFEQVSKAVVFLSHHFFFLLYRFVYLIPYQSTHPTPTQTHTRFLSLFLFLYKRNSVGLWHLSRMKCVHRESAFEFEPIQHTFRENIELSYTFILFFFFFTWKGDYISLQGFFFWCFLILFQLT